MAEVPDRWRTRQACDRLFQHYTSVGPSILGALMMRAGRDNDRFLRLFDGNGWHGGVCAVAAVHLVVFGGDLDHPVLGGAGTRRPPASGTAQARVPETPLTPFFPAVRGRPPISRHDVEGVIGREEWRPVRQFFRAFEEFLADDDLYGRALAAVHHYRIAQRSDLARALMLQLPAAWAAHCLETEGFRAVALGPGAGWELDLDLYTTIFMSDEGNETVSRRLSDARHRASVYGLEGPVFSFPAPPLPRELRSPPPTLMDGWGIDLAPLDPFDSWVLASQTPDDEAALARVRMARRVLRQRFTPPFGERTVEAPEPPDSVPRVAAGDFTAELHTLGMRYANTHPHKAPWLFLSASAASHDLRTAAGISPQIQQLCNEFGVPMAWAASERPEVVLGERSNHDEVALTCALYFPDQEPVVWDLGRAHHQGRWMSLRSPRELNRPPAAGLPLDTSSVGPDDVHDSFRLDRLLAHSRTTRPDLAQRLRPVGMSAPERTTWRSAGGSSEGAVRMG